MEQKWLDLLGWLHHIKAEALTRDWHCIPASIHDMFCDLLNIGGKEYWDDVTQSWKEVK